MYDERIEFEEVTEMDIENAEKMIELGQEEVERFVISNDKMADWCIKKMAEIDKEFERMRRIADEEIYEIEMKLEKMDIQATRKIDYYKGLLREYFGKVEHKETKTSETYKLFNGSLKMSKATQKMVKDDEALLNYVKASGQTEFIKTKESVAWADFKKNCVISDGKVVDMATGEVVEGVTVEDVPEEFEVKF